MGWIIGMAVRREQVYLAVICFLEDLLPDYYEIKVKYATLQLKMKILGNGQGYSLTEFCEEAEGYVFVAEMQDKKPYSLSMTDVYEIIEARRIAQRASDA